MPTTLPSGQTPRPSRPGTKYPIQGIPEFNVGLWEIRVVQKTDLARPFKLRLLNHDSKDSDIVWDSQSVLLILKKVKAVFITDFRPIAIISVVQKLYSRVLLQFADGRFNHLGAPQFAFRNGHQAHEPIHIIRTMVEKAVEWNVPLFVLDGDIAKALGGRWYRN